jgi:predicted SAM-dependent methyltransferase
VGSVRRARPLHAALHRLGALLRRGARHHCPVCGKGPRRFLPAGSPPRPHARCPGCGAVERHRLVWSYFERCTDLFDGRRKRLLHFAPEACLEPRLRRALGTGYVTADLRRRSAMLRMDVCAIAHPDASLDAVYCSHVLEHVVEDRLAMRELCRVLRPGGWAVLLVPIRAELTEEDPSVTDDAERLRRYGHPGHVRNYGRDYAQRLREAGFEVRVVAAAEFLTAVEVERYAVSRAAGEIFACARLTPAAQSPPAPACRRR